MHPRRQGDQAPAPGPHRQLTPPDIPPGTRLAGTRLLVVGASSGIGRAVALGAARQGALVGMSARRRTHLDDAALDGGPNAHPLTLDVTDEDSIAACVAEAVALLGGIDVLVYAAGVSSLAKLSATSTDEWLRTLSTNLIGAARVVSDVLTHLSASETPRVVLLSSHSVGNPWPGLVPYAASKAGLDEFALGLRAEEPWLRVIRVVVGNTATGFADGWDPDEAGRALERWLEGGYLRHEVQQPDDVAAAILDALATDGPDDITAVGPPV